MEDEEGECVISLFAPRIINCNVERLHGHKLWFFNFEKLSK